MRDVLRCLPQAALLTLALPGCLPLTFFTPAPLSEQLKALREHPQNIQQLADLVRSETQANPLLVQEVSLANISLGVSAREVTAQWGHPHRIAEQIDGTWWSFRGQSQEPGTVRVYLQPSKTTPNAQEVAQVQVWWPTRHMTRTMVRALDPAARVLRKYGTPPHQLPWGGGQAWIYPAANVAFVVTNHNPPQDAVVAGIIVGL
ncbi:MAG: hypothetical protein VKN33_09980 [Candidatus Sericytochromatia bacterium]|nr:hypothetical protein [Candidatus Sericytochromatia bacterium]